MLTEEKDDEKSFEKKRRNLMLLSTIILIYELGGGTIEKLPIPGGSITLAKPDVVIYFTWLAFVYFLWRFWQVAQPKHREIKHAFNAQRRDDRHFIRLAYKYYEKLVAIPEIDFTLFERRQKIFSGDNPIRYSPKEKIIAYIVEVGHTRFPFVRVLNFGPASTQSYNNKIEKQKGWTINAKKEVCVEVSFFIIFIIQLKVAFLTLIKHISFSDVYLPYLYWVFTAWVVFHDKFHI